LGSHPTYLFSNKKIESDGKPSLFYLLVVTVKGTIRALAGIATSSRQAVLTGVVRVAVGSKRRGICIAAIGYAYPVVSPTRLLAAVLRRVLQTTVVIATVATTATVLRSRRTCTRCRTAASTAVVSALTTVPEQPSQQVATVITAATARSIYVITHSILIPSCAFKTSVLYYIVCNK
jgi:hypothetical protein